MRWGGDCQPLPWMTSQGYAVQARLTVTAQGQEATSGSYSADQSLRDLLTWLSGRRGAGPSVAASQPSLGQVARS